MRYIQDRQLPDKAIDLIDEAASRRTEMDSMPEEMDVIHRKLQMKMEQTALEKEDDDAAKDRLVLLEQNIAQTEKAYQDLEDIWQQKKQVFKECSR